MTAPLIPEPLSVAEEPLSVAAGLVPGQPGTGKTESKKLSQPADAKELANWRNASESVNYSDGTVERVSTLKQLSIDDIRDLLNKSK